MKFFLLFLISFSVLASVCDIKVYQHRAVLAIEIDCNDPINQDDPWCEFEDDSKYAITWISFLKPIEKMKIKDKSLQSCMMTAFNKHKSLMNVEDEMVWGHKVSYSFKDESQKVKNKFVWRNPDYIEAK